MRNEHGWIKGASGLVIAAGLCLASGQARAADGLEIQRPQKVARTVTTSAPTAPVTAAAGGAAVAAAVAAPESASSGVAPEEASVSREADVVDAQSPREWKHSGFVLDAKVGMLGCMRTICASGHGADPGLRVGGFLGGNVGGILEVGVQGAWGRLRPNVGAGTNVLDLYGVDTAAVQAAVNAGTAGLAEDLDTSLLSVQGAELESIQAGFGLRVHFVPRGRFDLYAGSGVGYELFRTKYDTPGGEALLDFHGLGIPVQGGLSVFLTKRLALGADFEYRWTHFGLGTLQHPAQDVALPLSALERAGFGAENIGSQLPRFWTAGVTARLRV